VDVGLYLALLFLFTPCLVFSFVLGNESQSGKRNQLSFSSLEAINLARRDLYDNVIYVRQIENFYEEYPVSDCDWQATHLGKGIWRIEADVSFGVISIATQKKLDKRNEYHLEWNFDENSKSLSLTKKESIR